MDKNQIISIFYSPDLLNNAAKFEELVREAKAKNYGSVMGFVRHMKLNLFAPEVVAAVRQSTAICHRLGLKYLLEMDATWWGYQLAEREPETALQVCKKAEGRAFRGRFEATLSLPRVAMPYSQTTCLGVAAVYQMEGAAAPEFVAPAALKNCRHEYSLPMYGKKTYEAVQTHNFYRSGGGDTCVTVKGEFKTPYTGKVVLYVNFRDTSHAFVGHPRYLQYQKELLDLYRDIPLDGVGWDEAVRGADMESYKTGDGFLAIFADRKGYRLEEKLLWLDAFEQTPAAVRTRLDYFDVLSDINYRAQAEFNQYARQLFGPDITIGIHQTWGGIACDLRAGCFPYFKLGKLLTDAYTDTAWMVPRETVYQNFLADSLRKELGKPRAYLNDWGGIETNELTNYYTRLKLLFKMNWVTMYMGIASEGLPNFPVAEVWPETGACAKLLDQFNAFLGPDLLPDAEIAIWHGWEGIAYLNNFVVRLYHGAISNLAVTCLERNRPFDFVSSEALAKGQVEPGVVRLNGRTYRTLILPYACALPAAAYRRIKAMAKAGVRIIFFGPPPQWECDRARDISADFARLAGIAPLTIREYVDYYRETKPVPDFATSWEPPAVDFSYPVEITSGQARRDRNGALFAVSRGPVTYVPAADPRDDLIDLLDTGAEAEVRHYSDNSYFRFYTGADQRNRVLVIVAKQNRTLDSLLKIQNRELRVRGGRWAVLRLAGDRITETMLDLGVEVTWQGRKMVQS